ncbi:unnamed protein product, partial [Mesorhabditis belari]|uniref:Cysteine--tRNA ligase, cytoplasmic n=1 Tax=Mesorhabditis belari TaxID=2138241 RepID=A0AAF3EZ03_9BILA
MAEGAQRRAQAPWTAPTPTGPQLMLLNSMTRTKTVFVPNEGRKVTMYICGPTVYDHSHMGHARTYLGLDIIRRVLSDYFGYDVQHVMNITDIDDKIIQRGRQRHLLKEYLATVQNASAADVASDVIKALELFNVRFEKETDNDKRGMLEGIILKVNKSSKQLEEALKSKNENAIADAQKQLLADSSDVLMGWLDKEKGETIEDHAVFDSLSREFETEYFKDMTRLNVLPTDVLTRVSEYVPEIISYIERIIKNGYAYATKDGSVYFDTTAFTSNPKHFYAKLVPEAFADKDNLLKNMREGEGELSISADQLQMKKGETDFALWKASKKGEPWWVSPWGKGRPGWHIECSVMSNAICGNKLDIHAGGFDLRFPHHDNEIAQVEAHYDDPHWVNYFIHCGALRIQGLKMSKSLKNFITIRQALEDYSPRQLRILFLLHVWSDLLDYSKETMNLALHFETVTNEFFLLVKDLLRKSWKPDDSEGFQKFEEREKKLSEEFSELRANVHEALCDSIDTRTVMERLRKIVEIGNAYIVEKQKLEQPPNALLLRQLALYITKILRVFGVIPTSSEIGYPLSTDEDSTSKEETVMPYLNVLSEFREEVRKIAKANGVHDILKLSDKLRDEILPNLGVRLEDRGKETVIKLVDREALLKELEREKEVERKKQDEKREKELKKAAKDALKAIPPEEFFKQGEEAKKYLKWDEKGIPTHTADGEEVSKSLRKKLEKAWETQRKDHEDHSSKTNGKA